MTTTDPADDYCGCDDSARLAIALQEMISALRIVTITAERVLERSREAAQRYIEETR
jgi:hypothetical protein